MVKKYKRHDIEALFAYHDSTDIDTERFAMIRESAKILGKQIIKYGGEEDDIEVSIQKLRECVYYAIASIVVPKIGVENGIQ